MSKQNEEEDLEHALRLCHAGPFLTRLSVKRLMGFEEMEVKPYGETIITYRGGEGDGKTAFIMAFLLGIGYDILPEDFRPTTLCGIDLAHVVNRAHSECRLETTISLYLSPSLQQVFKSDYITVVRHIHRNHPIHLSPIEVAGTNADGKRTGSLQRISASELRLTLEMVGLNSKWFNIVLLDEINLNHLVEHPSKWYELYENSYLDIRRKLLKNLIVANLHSEKLEGDVSWRTQAASHMSSQLSKEYVMDSPILVHDKETDEKTLKNIYQTIEKLKEDIDTSQEESAHCHQDLEKLPTTLICQMKAVFGNFINSHTLNGDLVVDMKGKKIGIWINTFNSKEPIPENMNDIEDLWERTSTARKRIAVMGLYFAIWRINESLPVFVVDAFSCTETEFRLPERVVPVLMGLIHDKSLSRRTNHQQFLITAKAESHS